MKWSRYSHLFESKRNGWLLYNSASGSFLQLPGESVGEIRRVMAAPDDYDFSGSPHLYLTLRTGGHLVEDTQDDDFYQILKMRRLTANYAVRQLLLTVAITQSCNFSCSYCYEPNRTGSVMSREVAEKLLAFIDMHKGLDGLQIIWYGGEPLLGIGRIRELTRELDARERQFNAMIVTNGYLLTPAIMEELNDLHIGRMQITLDGSKKTHDSRRVLVGGGGTFDRILENLRQLMASSYKGIVNIRVNVDLRNKDEYVDVFRLIRSLFPEEFGKRITVYPGFVKGEGHPDAGCFFDSNLMGQFVADLYREEGISAKSLFPRIIPAGCTLTKRNAYVVGPAGELYKCWDDIGIPEMVIGRIDDMTSWNMPLIARGMVGCSYLDAPECRECFFFPVCDGGCHKVRLRNLEDGGSRDSCSYFRSHLEELLELHYEQKMSRAAAKKEEGEGQEALAAPVREQGAGEHTAEGSGASHA